MRQNNLILGNEVSMFKGAELESAMKYYAPAMFANNPSDKVSDKYTFLDSMNVIREMQKLGWEVTHVSNKGKGEHGMHMVRMFHNDLEMKLHGDEVMRPQLLFTNSHDGTQRAKMHIGLFRLVCSNGLVVGENGMHDVVELKHIYADTQEFINVTQLLHEKFDRIFPTIGRMQERILTKEERQVLAYIGITLRDKKYLMEDKMTPNFDLINQEHNIDSLLRPVRKEDHGESLFKTFNLLQEKLVKGKFYRYGKTIRQPRAITDAKRNIEFNARFFEASHGLLDMHGNPIETVEYTEVQ